MDPEPLEMGGGGGGGGGGEEGAGKKAYLLEGTIKLQISSPPPTPFPIPQIKKMNEKKKKKKGRKKPGNLQLPQKPFLSNDDSFNSVVLLLSFPI